MFINRSPTSRFVTAYGAKRCWTLQTAVAFWGMVFGFAIGCKPANHNVAKFRVGSSSMAPTWFGPHRTTTCDQCGHHSEVVDESYDPLVPTRCFNCGAVCQCTDPQAGEVIEITRSSSRDSLRRFDVVTFDTPENDIDTSPKTLKRIWAVPGERIELRDGEAWINGKQQQKSPMELAEVCLPLSRFPKDARSHWWVAGASGSEPIRIEAAAKQSHLNLESSQRLEFRYVRPNRNPQSPEMLPSPIVDDFPFNQNSITQFHEVPDFLLAIELVEPIPTPWFVSLKSKGKHYKVCVGSSSETSGQMNSSSTDFGAANRLVIAVCDGRLFLSTEKNSSQWKLVDLDERLETDDELQEQLITISTTETLRIKRLLVARDQWLGPSESRFSEWTSNETEAEVARGYFVLGDNLPLSIDSRDSSIGRIALDRITGKAKRSDETSEWILPLLNRAFREVAGR